MKPLLALTLAAVLALAGCSEDEPAPQRLAPAISTASSKAPKPDLADLVDDPKARIIDVTVRRNDPSVRSVLWSLCRTPECYRVDQVLAVTDDGFATRHLVVKPQQTVTTALDGVFLLTNRRGGEIVQPDGSRTPVDWRAGEPGPLTRSEHPVGIHQVGRLHAVDPRTGAGHLVPTPGEARGVHRDGSGALSISVLTPGEGAGYRMIWSHDGGRTWDEPGAFDVPSGQLTGSIDSATSTIAVVTGGDGATLLPLGGLHVDDGSGWRSFPGFDDPMAYLGSGGDAVLPDGRLLLTLDSWSDSWRDGPSGKPVGLWVSRGQDWSDLSPVPMGAPFDTLDLRRDSSPILDVVAAPGKVTVYAVHDAPTGRTLWSSTDAGRTWTEVPAR
ncbi:MAG: sialidase family protein [Nocardioides sp.]|nr:sialidase family protein [Nocardioides sp.]